jgi:CBS domain-containing protein
MTRVVLEQKSPSTTTVADVMTGEIVCIAPERDAEEAMALMRAYRVRHLPVVEGGIVIGMISMGDLVRWASDNQDSEIRMLQEYVAGVYS